MKPELGTWLSIGSPVIAELAAQCGFDWVLIDLEHGCSSEADVLPQLLAIRGSTTRGIVRLGAPHPDLIARLLDRGVDGLMVPHVNNAETAVKIVRSTRYSPRGTRGYSRTVRANDYGLRSLDDGDPPILMAQIETVEGVNNAADIAAVDGIDVLFVGPADLQHDFQHCDDSAPGDYEHCLTLVAESARAAGKKAGILLRDLSDLPKFVELGFAYIAVDSDLAILRKSYQDTVKRCGDRD